MPRVAITGIGAVSPNGIGRERFWEATRNGVSGVRRITRFDPSGFVVQVAGARLTIIAVSQDGTVLDTFFIDKKADVDSDTGEIASPRH